MLNSFVSFKLLFENLLAVYVRRPPGPPPISFRELVAANLEPNPLVLVTENFELGLNFEDEPNPPLHVIPLFSLKLLYTSCRWIGSSFPSCKNLVL